MADREKTTIAAFGFLTVVHDPEQGAFGGYLALNAAGRPLEFHCTAPVKPNRAQEILFGPTLPSFLEGELIGGALLARAKTTPLAVFTDRSPILAVRATWEYPLACVVTEAEAPEASAASGSSRPPARPTPASSRWIVFGLGANRLAVDSAWAADRGAIEKNCGSAANLDLLEPFTRIREALEEARSTAVAGTRPSRQGAAA